MSSFVTITRTIHPFYRHPAARNDPRPLYWPHGSRADSIQRRTSVYIYICVYISPANFCLMSDKERSVPRTLLVRLSRAIADDTCVHAYIRVCVYMGIERKYTKVHRAIRDSSWSVGRSIANSFLYWDIVRKRLRHSTNSSRFADA